MFKPSREDGSEASIVPRASPQAKGSLSKDESRIISSIRMAADDEEDAFGVFGSSDSSDDGCDDQEQEQEFIDSKKNIKKISSLRDRNNSSVLVFHEGTEQALLVYVRQQLQRKEEGDDESNASLSSQSCSTAAAASTAARRLLRCVDDFCWQRHWMMHVGHDKGVLLEVFLRERLQQVHSCDNTEFVVVELGTYCGYSLIRMAATILESCCENTSMNFTIYTVDVDPQTQRVARQMVQLVPGLSERVAFVLLSLNYDGTTDYESNCSLSQQLLQTMRERGSTNNDDNDAATPSPPQIDFLFIDHAKEMYLTDLRHLEQSGMVRRGTAVAADNVVFFRLEGYRKHMRELHEAGIVTTRLHDQGVYIEYSHRRPSAEDTNVPTTKDANHPNLQQEPPEPETAELRDGLGMNVVLFLSTSCQLFDGSLIRMVCFVHPCDSPDSFFLGFQLAYWLEHFHRVHSVPERSANIIAYETKANEL